MIQQQFGEAWNTELPAIADDAKCPPEQRCRALDLMQLLGPFPETSLLVRLTRRRQRSDSRQGGSPDGHSRRRWRRARRW